MEQRQKIVLRKIKKNMKYLRGSRMSRKQNSGSQEQKKGILNLGRYHTLSASMSPTTFFFSSF